MSVVELAALTDSAIHAALSEAAGPMVVAVSQRKCTPCRWMHPVLEQVAFSLGEARRIVAVDGDRAKRFTQAHDIKAFPTLLFLRDGVVVERKVGFGGLKELRASIRGFLGLPSRRDAAEAAFDERYAAARAAMDEIMAAASKALEPHFLAIEPQMEAARAAAMADRDAGKCTAQEAQARIAEAWRRLSAPFQKEVADLSAAQEAGFARFEALALQALAEYARDRGGSAAEACAADDPLCMICH